MIRPELMQPIGSAITMVALLINPLTVLYEVLNRHSRAKYLIFLYLGGVFIFKSFVLHVLPPNPYTTAINMTTTTATAGSFIAKILDIWPIVPIITAAVIIGSLFFIFNRRITVSSDDDVCPLPPWVPLEAGVIGALIQLDNAASYVLKIFRLHANPAFFGLTRRHRVMHRFGAMEKLFSKGPAIIDASRMQLSMVTRVFGADITPTVAKAFGVMHKGLSQPLERSFLSKSGATERIKVAEVHRKVASLITFTSDSTCRSSWEQSANPVLLDDGATAQVNLQVLLRDFGAAISIPLLYGQKFLDDNPNLLRDLWTFDNDAFGMLVIGIPAWFPIPTLQRGIAARNRLHKALTAYHARLRQSHNINLNTNQDNDISDASEAAYQRTTVFNDFGISTELRGQIELSAIWGLNANTQPLIFWMITYVYATPGLVEALREEVLPCMTLASSSTTIEILALDHDMLSQECQLLKSTFFETLRMVNEATSIRQVVQSVSVSDGTSQHHFSAGTWISAPHAGTQRDSTIYPSPHEFIPDRFLSEDDSQPGQKVAQYKTLRPWGIGSGMCKGRTFAEKEALSVVACIVMMWNIKPIGGKWEIPAANPGTGIKRPNKDVRANMSRRSNPNAVASV